jgi:hypothetical protein
MIDRWLIDTKQMKVLIYEPKVLGDHIVDVVEKAAYDKLVKKLEMAAAFAEHALELGYFANGGSTEMWAREIAGLG